MERLVARRGMVRRKEIPVSGCYATQCFYGGYSAFAEPFQARVCAVRLVVFKCLCQCMKPVARLPRMGCFLSNLCGRPEQFGCASGRLLGATKPALQVKHKAVTLSHSSGIC